MNQGIEMDKQEHIIRLEGIIEQNKTDLETWRNRVRKRSTLKIKPDAVPNDYPCYYCEVQSKGCPYCIHSESNILLELMK